jgi:hypothetical protein
MLARIAVLAVLGVVAVVVLAAFARGGGAAAIASSSPRSSIAPSSPSPTGSALTGGGPLAQKLVAALHSDPFRAHIDETTVARSTTGNVTITLTAKAEGDVSGRDVALHVTSTGGGPAVDQEVVSLGSTTWIRRTGATTWEVHRRLDAAASIDGLLSTIQLIDDPSLLADAGPDTLDGQAVRHLTAIGTIGYRSPDGVDASYDRLDIWTTGAGIPVLVRGSFSGQNGTNSVVGNVSIRYRDVGEPVTISPPGGAPTPIP